MRYRIVRTRRAREDLAEIAAYTLKTWGPEHMASYMRDLDATIRSLRSGPTTKGISHDAIRHGLRSVRHRPSYLIFFRVEAKQVEVLRILHARRDWPRLMTRPGTQGAKATDD